jgi:outer membrane protein TolC
MYEGRSLTWSVSVLCAVTALVLLFAATGCKSPSEYRVEADDVASSVIHEKQRQALGEAQEFSIERPIDTLRRRLLVDQNLPYSSNASLGADRLETVEHWPEEGYPKREASAESVVDLESREPLTLPLMAALQIGARNSFEYQTRKEDVFLTALDLDLERNEFRTIFASQVESLISTDGTGDERVSGMVNSAALGASRRFANGTEVTSALAVDLANLLTLNNASSFGIAADATIAIPLLRGSGRHIVAEPLTQAERDVVYAIYEFERFKRVFAVDIASDYLAVLGLLDAVRNAESNYRSLIASARRSRRLADAGRLPEIQVDQAVQNELLSRNRWIAAKESYERSLDAFKNSLGVPPDAEIELERGELDRLTERALEIMSGIIREEASVVDGNQPGADAPVEVIGPGREGAGPLEIEESVAIDLALSNRLDLRVEQGVVYDAQRRVVVAADRLRAELTLFGSAQLGERRSVSSADENDATLRFDEGVYSALLTLDLPLERTAERNAYRSSFIDLERAVRDVQSLEDEIKLDVRNELSDLLQSRESFKIQAKSVVLAEKRVKSTELFLQAGRGQIQMRDLLDAQDDLLSAQNRLTAAAVSYRVAELELQRDMGLLKIDERGLWQEYVPQVDDNVQK